MAVEHGDQSDCLYHLRRNHAGIGEDDLGVGSWPSQPVTAGDDVTGGYFGRPGRCSIERVERRR
jgi:hypothetical protein